MAEIEKEEVEFPACATLWQGNSIRWQHLIFLFIYIVQLYKEDWGILRMLGCRAVALPSTEQIVNVLLSFAVTGAIDGRSCILLVRNLPSIFVRCVTYFPKGVHLTKERM